MCSYVQEVLDSGKSMNIRTFGSFTFEPILYAGGHAKNPRGDKLHFRPCFLVAPELRKHLYRYPGKEEMTMQEGSIYQQGCQMSFLNYVPIAAGTYLKEPVIRASLKAFFAAVVTSRCGAITWIWISSLRRYAWLREIWKSTSRKISPDRRRASPLRGRRTRRSCRSPRPGRTRT